MTAVKAASIVFEMDAIDGGSVWVDVTDDVMISTPVEIEYGIRSNVVTDRTATSGYMSLALNNSCRNSASVQGYYSPDGASIRTGFAVGVKTRCQITYSGSTFTKFVGWIDDILPVPGSYRERATEVTVTDWVDAAARYKINASVPPLLDKTGDEIIEEFLDVIVKQPESTSLEAGQDTFSYGATIGKANVTTILRDLQKISRSELGYVYQKGNNASGGELVFEDRHFRIESQTSSASLNDSMTHLKLKRARKRVRNIIRTRVHPKDVSTGASSTLFTLEYTPGISADKDIVITAEYQDADNANRQVGAYNIVPPIAGVDYTINSAEGGGGDDMTYDQKGKVMSISASNTSASNLFGYWPFDEASGCTVLAEVMDYYGNHNATACCTMGDTGIGDGRTSASIASSGEYIDFFSASLSGDIDEMSSASLSMGAWFQWDESASIPGGASTINIGQLATCEADTWMGWKKEAGACTLAWVVHAGGAASNASMSSCPSQDSWFHLGLVADTSGCLIGYHNGASVGSVAWPGTWAGSLSASHCLLGDWDKTDTAGSGAPVNVGHFFIANKKISSSEMLEIYNAKTGGFNVDAEIGGFAAEITFTNQEDAPGYITLLTMRGDLVRDFQPITQEEKDQTSIDAYGEMVLTFDMPLQEDPLVGQDAAEFLLSTRKDPATEIDTIRFIANKSDAHMKAALQIEPGDRVRIQETISGIDSDWYVNGVAYKIKDTEIIEVTWWVVPTADVQFWAIGVAGKSEIGETTYVTY